MDQVCVQVSHIKSDASNNELRSSSISRPKGLQALQLVEMKNRNDKAESKAQDSQHSSTLLEVGSESSPVSPSDSCRNNVSEHITTGISIQPPQCAVFSPRDPSTKLACQTSLSSKMDTFIARDSSVTSEVEADKRIDSPRSLNISLQETPDSTSFSVPSSPVAVSKRNCNSPSPAPPIKANTGRWTEAEHKLFLKGLETFPYRAWKKIATLIKTRTVVQIRTHAQKYYQKLEKEEARMKEREIQVIQEEVGIESDDPVLSPSSVSGMEQQSDLHLQKKKVNSRKRKVTIDETPIPSIPKRLVKEKKFPQEKHMSPKQKTSNGKIFMSQLNADGDNVRITQSRSSVLKAMPMEFEDSTMMDFSDDKGFASMGYSISLDGMGVHDVDHDLLQLTDEEENLDWFTTGGHDQDGLGESSEMSLAGPSSPLTDSPASSPLAFSRAHFSPLYNDENINFLAPSSSHIVSDSMLVDDDEDFVLDPEKFLSSYFNLGLSKC